MPVDAAAPVTLRDLHRAAAARLRQAGTDTADLDASILLADLLGIDRAALYARLPDVASRETAETFAQRIDRRVRGEPVAYIVGHKEFFGLDFAISPAVLVPRPETELLVQWTIDWLRERLLPARVVDVGVGSGAIAVTVAQAIPSARLIACDLSLAALRVARGNAARHQVSGRLHFVQGDLLAWLGQPADLLLANLPYLTDAQMDEPSISAEPRLALMGGDADGFGLYRRLIREAHERLMPGGAFAFEIDPAQADIAVAWSRQAFGDAAITVHNDLAGLARFVTVEALLSENSW